MASKTPPQPRETATAKPAWTGPDDQATAPERTDRPQVAPAPEKVIYRDFASI